MLQEKIVWNLSLLFIFFPADTPERVDWLKTTAYAAAHGIYGNIKGRTLRGIVEPGKEYDEVRDSIIELLRKTQYPDSSDEDVYFEEAEETIRNRLKSLGYI